jgi:hypothetical protein
MSLLEKFGAEQGDQHPGPLTWPGSGMGLPILGRAAPNIRQTEFEDIDHKCVYDAAEFRSWVREDMDRYKYIQERANNVGDAGVTWFAIRQYERARDLQGRGWVIWLEWVQVYGVLPKELTAQGGPDAVKEFVQRNRTVEFLAGGEVDVFPAAESWEQAEPGAGNPLHPGPESWPAATPSGARGYFDPFAPRNGGHA